LIPKFLHEQIDRKGFSGFDPSRSRKALAETKYRRDKDIERGQQKFEAYKKAMGNEAFERMKLTPKDFLSEQTKSKSSFGPGPMELQMSAPSDDQFAKKMLASNPQGHKRHIKLDQSLEIIDSAENSPRRSQLAQNERYVSNSPVRNEVYMKSETTSRRDAKYNHFVSTVSISTVGNSESNFNKVHNRRGSLKHSVEVVNARAAGHSGIEERHKSYKNTSVLRNGAI
jgi:hypothetical protein